MDKGNFLRTVDLKNNHKLTAISLFTGAGGAALGVCRAGFEVRVMLEWDNSACQTLKANWVDRPKNWRKILEKKKKIYYDKLSKLKGKDRDIFEDQEIYPFWWQERPPKIMQVDITKTKTSKILKKANLEVGEADILEGGFPCQGFSTAGKRMINDPRNSLYKECVRVIREALPRSFLLENVSGLVSMGKGTIIDQICKDLADVGYDVVWERLNAADFGVPQHRVRVFFIGKRIDIMRFQEKGNPALHIGCAPGSYTHPSWFERKYKIYSHRSPWDVQ